MSEMRISLGHPSWKVQARFILGMLSDEGQPARAGLA